MYFRIKFLLSVCTAKGPGRGELGGAIEDGSSHVDQTDGGAKTAAENQETQSRQWEEGNSRFHGPFSSQQYLYACSCHVLSAQVLSVRKRGVFPGQQFSLDGDDEDEDGDDSAVLERKIHGANMPDAALRVCLKELKRWVLALIKPSASPL